jgi:hypothetical protein
MGGKHGTACQGWLVGTWPTTDEGSRVDEFFHAGAGEDDADQIAAVVIDDPAGPASVAVGVQLHLVARRDHEYLCRRLGADQVRQQLASWSPLTAARTSTLTGALLR